MPTIDLAYACPNEIEESETDNIAVNLGKRIKQIREAEGMSRSELGKALELNNPDIRIGSYENGKKFPRIPMLKKIADALGVSWQWLMTGRIDAVTYMTMNEFGTDFVLSNYDALMQLLETNVNSISDKQLDAIIKCFDMIGII
jgi:transcriptional regulator with XRE-family HTH domain